MITHDFGGSEGDEILCWEKFDDNRKRKPQVGQRKPREDQGEYVILCRLIISHADSHADLTYKGLDMEEEHPDRVVPGLVQLEEVHSGVLYEEVSHLVPQETNFAKKGHTTEAANEPFSQRRRCPMSSAALSGTSVSALLGFTYVRVHRSPAFAASSKHRIRSSARNMFFVKIFIP